MAPTKPLSWSILYSAYESPEQSKKQDVPKPVTWMFFHFLHTGGIWPCLQGVNLVFFRAYFSLCSHGWTTFCLIFEIQFSNWVILWFFWGWTHFSLKWIELKVHRWDLLCFPLTEKSAWILIILTYFTGIWEKTTNFLLSQLAVSKLTEV